MEATQFNTRLQPLSISAALAGPSNTFTRRLRLSYGYGPGNNGNVASETMETGAQAFPQAFGYDALNRLQVVSETGSASLAGNLRL